MRTETNIIAHAIADFDTIIFVILLWFFSSSFSYSLFALFFFVCVFYWGGAVTALRVVAEMGTQANPKPRSIRVAKRHPKKGSAGEKKKK